MSTIRAVGPYRTLITRTVMLYLLLILIWRGYSCILPFQLENPPLTNVEYDLSFWVFKLSNLSGILVGSRAGSIIFSTCIILNCLACILYPLNRLLLISFSFLFLLFGITFNVYLTHSSHVLGGALIISIPFWASRDKNFETLWEALRYYVCWIYFSAFLWKVVNGSMFQENFGVLTMKKNLAEYLYHNPDTIKAHIYSYFISHPLLPDIGDKLVYLLEGLFLAGFFTKRYDKILIVLLLIIHAITYFFTDRLFIELCILVFPLMSARLWERISSRTNRARRAEKPGKQL